METSRRFSLNACLTNPPARPAFDVLVVRTVSEQLPPTPPWKTGRNGGRKKTRGKERERERIVVDREDRKTEWLIVVETAARVFSPLSRCEEREIQQWRKMKSIRLRDTEIFFLAFIRFRGRHWCDDNKVPGLGKKGRWRLRYPWKVAKTWNFFKKKGGFCFEKFFLKLEFSRCVFSR